MKKDKNISSILMWIFIIIVAVVCLICLTVSTYFFVCNQLKFSKAYSDTTMMIISTTEGSQEIAQSIIEHLQQLQMIQKNAASSDVMSFLYSLLSTILVGVCAGFVIKSNASAEQAKESANSAKENADNLTKLTDNVSKKIGEAEEGNRKSYSQMEKLKAFLEVEAVRIEILHAREAFRLGTAYERINERIKAVSQAVGKLTKNSESVRIRQLQTELLRLCAEVDNFRKTAEEDKNEEKTVSLLSVADWYDEKLMGAVNHCDMLLK